MALEEMAPHVESGNIDYAHAARRRARGVHILEGDSRGGDEREHLKRRAALGIDEAVAELEGDVGLVVKAEGRPAVCAREAWGVGICV